MIHRTLRAACCAALFTAACGAVAADDDPTSDIQSVEQVKDRLREAFQGLADCGTGGCVDHYGTQICNRVAELDVRVGYAITGTMSGVKPDLPITRPDLALLRRIYGFCKPTNYRYWANGTILHVAYMPDKKADAQIRKRLGVKKTSNPED